jgi:hypothetical protein
VTSLPQ